MRRIISASRRTDIAAFYSRWFLRRLDEGFCDAINPFNARTMRVSLAPEDCIGLVFWTRFPAPVLPHLSGIDRRGYRYYFHVTINGYGRELEPRNPAIGRAVDAFRRLSDTISPERVIWRYDPVILSDRTPPDYHAARFESLARDLEGYTNRCYFSFLDLYGKTRRNLVSLERRGGPAVAETSPAARLDLAVMLRDLTAARGMTLYACCEDALVGAGIEKAHCVDLDLLGPAPERLKSAPTRKECGCVESVDIGAYDTCRFGCVYCYATNSHAAAVKRSATHDPADSALWRPSSLIGSAL